MKLYQIDGDVVYINDITDIREYVSEDIWEAISDQFKGLENEINEQEKIIEDLETTLEEREVIV